MAKRFSKQLRFGGPDHPPVPFSAIRGEWHVFQDLAWPAVVWNGGRCWCYMHDMTANAREAVMAALRDAELERSHPHGVLRWPA